MLAELRNWKLWEFIAYKLFMAAMMSSFMISQEALKKAPVKPSGPGALSDGMESIVSLTSSCVKGSSKSERSRGVYPRECQSRLACLGADEPIWLVK